MAEKEITLLNQLARLYGVETSYYDGMGRLQQAPVDSLLAVLKALGAPLDGLKSVESALREYRQECWQRFCEPVAVVWSGQPAGLEINSPVENLDMMLDCRLVLENGETICWTCELGCLSVKQVTVVEGAGYVVLQLDLPAGLPCGYHRLGLALPAFYREVLLIVAPGRAWEANRTWGVFLPTYALGSQRSIGAGDFNDLGQFLEWIQSQGGSMAGTLPLLPSFMDVPFEPSPYLPVSRLFWNEFYIDVAAIPEFERCPKAKELYHSPDFQREVSELNMLSLVDYRRVMTVKRKILQHLARCFFSGNGERQSNLREWVNKCPVVRDYARFRAVVEARRAGWPAWPERMRKGIIKDGDYDPRAEQYHMYVQWIAREQMQSLAGKSKEQGSGGLYLDLPLGVNSAGYDVWREQNSFVLDVSTGAPPDAFFTRGQDWGFSPLHPERIREHGYQYLIACLRHHMRYAGVLRLDHVAWLHRLLWIPKGLEPKKGVYVRYRSEELYALLTLESQRNQAVLIGEDLGTVHPYVRAAMDRHNIYRMYILQFQQAGDGSLNPVPATTLAGLNTHDMPPFSTFWAHKDYHERLSMVKFLTGAGWLEPKMVKAEEVLEACLKFLAASPARILLINLEDLWLEMAPQNVPGTRDEHPNWRRKARYTLEIIKQMSRWTGILQEINRLRRLPPVKAGEVLYSD